jgi:arylsulfatase A-like enzyme
MVNRRRFLKTIGLGAAAAAVSSSARGAARAVQSKRPNILFLFTDDQRFNTLNAMGNPAIKTPNLDKLVHNGVAFSHAFIMGSTIGAVCVCSRAMLLTGQHLYHCTTLVQEKCRDLTLWPETFRKTGYTTFGIGKWHNGPWSYARCFAQGAKIFYGGMGNQLQVPVYDFDPAGKYPADQKYTGDKFSSEMFSDAAIKFLKEHENDKPFFLYVSYTAPHDPRMAPKEYADLYPPDTIEVPKNFLPQHPFDNGELKVRDELLAKFPRTPEEIREHVAAYYAMITHLDAQIGRVVQALEETGQAENTIIIFSGDNGLALGQHGLMGKQSVYDHSVRVPLVFAGKNVEKGKKVDSLVYLHDVFPTTCEMAGLEIPRTVESQSLVPLLTGKQEKIHESVFAGYRQFQRMVRNESYKLIRYPYVNKTQLFDIRNDPLEMNDISGDSKNAKLIEQLNADLKRWQKRAGDDLDLENPPALPPPEAGKGAAGAKKAGKKKTGKNTKAGKTSSIPK